MCNEAPNCEHCGRRFRLSGSENYYEATCLCFEPAAVKAREEAKKRAEAETR